MKALREYRQRTRTRRRARRWQLGLIREQEQWAENRKAVYGTQADLANLLDLAARVTIKMANIRTKKVLKKNGTGSKTKVLDERILKW